MVNPNFTVHYINDWSSSSVIGGSDFYYTGSALNVGLSTNTLFGLEYSYTVVGHLSGKYRLNLGFSTLLGSRSTSLTSSFESNIGNNNGYITSYSSKILTSLSQFVL